MKFLEQNLAFLFIFISFGSFAQELALQQCTSYEKTGAKKVIFGCEGGEKLALEFLDSKNIKFWYAPTGEFSRSNESFAVVNEEFDPEFSIDVKENPSNFEIFTGDLRVMIHKKPFKILIYDRYQRLVLGDLDGAAYVTEGTKTEARKVLREEEQFLGLEKKQDLLTAGGVHLRCGTAINPAIQIQKIRYTRAFPSL